MPLYLSIPLPGPFRYSKRVGGGKRRRKPQPPTYGSLRKAQRQRLGLTYNEADQLMLALRRSGVGIDRPALDWLETQPRKERRRIIAEFRETGVVTRAEAKPKPAPKPKSTSTWKPKSRQTTEDVERRYARKVLV